MTSSWWAAKLGVEQTPAARPQWDRNTTYVSPAREHYAPPPPVEEGRVPPQGQMDIMTAVSMFKGSKAANAIESCPSCGSPHVFAITAGGILGNSPAPRCTACGWNGGKFEQGDQSSWIA